MIRFFLGDGKFYAYLYYPQQLRNNDIVVKVTLKLSICQITEIQQHWNIHECTQLINFLSLPSHGQFQGFTVSVKLTIISPVQSAITGDFNNNHDKKEHDNEMFKYLF